MHLAQDNDVVHTLTPDRSDQPFGKAILPGRGWCGSARSGRQRFEDVCDPGSGVGFATAQRTPASSDKSVGSCLFPLRTASLPIFVRAVTNASLGAY
jgi:hypothetical protein